MLTRFAVMNNSGLAGRMFTTVMIAGDTPSEEKRKKDKQLQFVFDRKNRCIKNDNSNNIQAIKMKYK